MQGIYNYKPETNHACCVYIVAVILQLQFMINVMLLVMLYVSHFHISISRSVCAVPKMAVLFSSLISSCPGLLVGYFMNEMEVVPVADIMTDITSAVYIPHALYFYCKVFIF